MITRRSFLAKLLGAGTVTAAGLLIPESTKFIFDLGANTYRNTPWEFVAWQTFDYNNKVGIAFKRRVNGIEQRHAVRINSFEGPHAMRGYIDTALHYLNEPEGHSRIISIENLQLGESEVPGARIIGLASIDGMPLSNTRGVIIR
jgi:hypothetical protein